MVLRRGRSSAENLVIQTMRRSVLAIDDAGRRIPPPLAKLLSQLRKLFEPVYQHEDVAYAEKNLNSSEFFARYFKEALGSEGWHTDDYAEIAAPAKSNDIVSKSLARQPKNLRANKRVREDDKDGDGNCEARPFKRVALARSDLVLSRSAPTALGVGGLPR